MTECIPLFKNYPSSLLDEVVVDPIDSRAVFLE